MIKVQDLTDIPVNFSILFWNNIESLITRAIKNSNDILHFTEPNKLGIIACMPKAKKKLLLASYKCLEYGFKIASECIAKRTKSLLDN